MSPEPVISATNLSKAYRIWESPASRLTAPLQAAVAGVLPGTAGRWWKQRAAQCYRDFWALKEINFEVKKGESVGIIGRNGSGKSTLLQIIAGTLQPTEGAVKVNGRVAALLELGSGFNPEFTGRENVYLNGAVLGLTRREIDARFDDIAAFADIGDFLDQPVKTYSNGMLMRLAFAVQTAVEPDVLIVDEALSVGDFFFQQKCFQRIRHLRQQGTTILFVSHDMASVRDLCNRAIYLQRGQLVYCGETQHAISSYFRESDTSAPIQTTPAPAAASARKGSRQVEQVLASAQWRQTESEPLPGKPAQLLAVEILDVQERPAMKHRMSETAIFRGYFRAHQDAEMHMALEFKNRNGQVVSSLGSRVQGLPPVQAKTGQVWCFEARLPLRLEAGEYSFQFCLGLPHPKPNIGIRFAESPWLGPITISWDYETETAPFLGMFDLPADIAIREVL